MKTRKLYASIAAAATLLAGMAFGAAGAQAAGNAAIEVQHSQEGHTYSAYKFATLTVDGEGTSVQVDTDSAWTTAVQNAVDEANAAQTPAQTMPGEYEGNPAAYAATKTGTANEAWFRAFAAAMMVQGTADGMVEGNGGSASIDGLAEGWYLVTDAYEENGRPAAGVNAIVATTLDGVAGTFKVVGDRGTGQGQIEALGTFVAKNENVPDVPDKEADDVTTADGVAIGQTVTYTIKVSIPATASGYDSYAYFVRDIASKGLTVDKDSFAAVIGADAIDFTFENEPTVGADGTTTTVLKFDLAGKSGTLTVTYQATVNADIVDMANKVSNSADVSRDGTSWGLPDEVDSYTGGFTFHKYGVGDDVSGLAGAVFNVYEGESASGEPLKFIATADCYRLAEASEAGASEAVTTTTGNIVVNGLKSGKYTVKEVGFVSGYAQNFVPEFTVEVTVDQQTGASSFNLTGSNNLGLAGMSDKVIEVKNVKNITQLPLTGAAGTALFTIVALLMAGSGLAVAFKSRGSDVVAA